jgi:hypothetical protein
MKWYPAILGIGITPDAVRIYKAFKWAHYRDMWRLVHPLRLERMMEDYGGRLAKPWQRGLLSAMSGVYNFAAGAIEAVLSGAGLRPAIFSESDLKAAVVAEYLPMYQSGDLIAANVGGAGRIGNPPASWSAKGGRQNSVKPVSESSSAPDEHQRGFPVAVPSWLVLRG